MRKSASGRVDGVDFDPTQVSVVVGKETSAAAAPAPSHAGGKRRPIVGGNWKCNPATASSLDELVSNFDGCAAYLDKCDVYVCPSNLHVALVKDSFKPGAAAASKNLWRTRL